MNTPATLQPTLNRFRERPPHALLLTSRAFSSRGLTVPEALSIAESLCGLPAGYPAVESLVDLRHPDIWIADPERNTLRLEELSALPERVNFPPQQLRRRLIIIDRAGRLNTHASNSLLKALEEPLVPCLYLLTASCVQDLLPTIASRCVRAHVRLDETDTPSARSALEDADRQFLQLVVEGLTRPGIHPEVMRRHSPGSARGYSFFDRGLEAAEQMARKYPWIVLIDALAEEVSEHCRGQAVHSMGSSAGTDGGFAPGIRWLIARLRDWRANSEYNPSAVLRMTEITLAASREGRRVVPF